MKKSLLAMGAALAIAVAAQPSMAIDLFEDCCFATGRAHCCLVWLIDMWFDHGGEFPGWY